MEIARARRDRPMQGMLLTNYAESLIAMERWKEAEEMLAEALAIARAGDDPAREAEGLKFQGILERERGRYGPAAQHLRDALALARRVNDPLLVAEVLRELGDLRLREGDATGAMTDWTEALRGFETLHATLDADVVRMRLATLPQWTARAPTEPRERKR
jgi:tetratricopeptide (TPR) repeat protein